jgi:hypothetical protein
MVFSGLLERCLINDGFVVFVDGGDEMIAVMSVEVLYV